MLHSHTHPSSSPPALPSSLRHPRHGPSPPGGAALLPSIASSTLSGGGAPRSSTWETASLIALTATPAAAHLVIFSIAATGLGCSRAPLLPRGRRAPRPAEAYLSSLRPGKPCGRRTSPLLPRGRRRTPLEASPSSSRPAEPSLSSLCPARHRSWQTVMFVLAASRPLPVFLVPDGPLPFFLCGDERTLQESSMGG